MISLKIKLDYFYKLILKINLFWAVCAPLILAFIFNFIQITSLFILKDLVFYVSFLVLFFVGKPKGLFFLILKVTVFVCYLILLTGVFFELNSWIVYNFRQLLAPLLIVAFGYYLNLSKESLRTVIRFFYKLLILVVIIGVAIKIFNIWDYFSLANFFNAKGIPVDSRGLSYMFYEPAFGYTERLASTVLDPISLGHILAAGAIACFYGVYIQGKKKWLYFSILLIGLLLTFSKGALLQLILGLFFFNKRLNHIIRFIIPALFVLTVLLLINLDGVLIHLIGLKNAIIYMNLFGHGIGLVGNYAKMFADDLTVYNTLKISDTFIGSVLGQIGLIGLFLWLAFFLKFSKGAILGRRTFVGSTIILSQLIVGILSENTLNFTSFIIPGIIGALLVKQKI